MLSVTAQLPFDQGGLEGSVAFIDTEGTFMPERVYQIASARGLDPQEIAKNIHVARAYNSSHQYLLIDKIFTLCPENNVKLVVIDSPCLPEVPTRFLISEKGVEDTEED